METVNKKPEQIFSEWKASLESPDSSIFYYHSSLERIILGLSLYQIASRQYISKIKKEKTITIFNTYINDMVTAWIDDSEYFEFPFHMLMTLSEGFHLVTSGLTEKHPGLRKVYKALLNTFFFWNAVAGDMSQEKADQLLDTIETDGKRIDSTQIAQFIQRLQPIVASRAMEMNEDEMIEIVESINSSTL